MTQGIIEKYFLESGSSKRHEINELERRCAEKGFVFDRTGQFGIGVLSYFMLADKLVIKTKREMNTGYHDSESVAWRFEINGTHDFGELSKLNKPVSGTEIELKLKQDINEHIDEWDFQFFTFLKYIINKCPCLLTYQSTIKDYYEKLVFGWTSTMHDIKTKIADQIKKDATQKIKENEIISANEKEKIFRNNQLIMEIDSEAYSILDFLFDQGEIKNFGKYRIFIPYFKLAYGNSFFYLKEDIKSEHLILKVNKGFYWSPTFNDINLSLKGMKIRIGGKARPMVNNFKPFAPNAYIDIDIDTINEKQITVSRHEIILDEKFLEFKKIIDEKTNDLIQKHKSSFINRYEILNSLIIGSEPHKLYFSFYKDSSSDALTWKEVQYPVVESSFYFRYYKDLKLSTKKLNILEPISNFLGEKHLFSLNNMKAEFQMAIFKNGIARFQEIFLILNKEASQLKKRNSLEINHIELPKKFDSIVLYVDGYDYNSQTILLNKNSNFCKLYDYQIFLKIIDLGLNIELKELKDQKWCFSFLLNLIMNYQKEKWVSLCENKNELLIHAFKILDIEELKILRNTELISISTSNWISKRATKISFELQGDDTLESKYVITAKTVS